MNTKIMEGLAGAGKNMELINTPMRVYKEARRKGDTAAMERAMGYACDFADKAEEYRSKADEGVKEDAKAAREKAELEAEEAVRKRKEEREKEQEKLEKELEERRNRKSDIVEISEDGKALLKDGADLENTGFKGGESEAALSGDGTTAPGKREPVIYTKTGEAKSSSPDVGAEIAVSV